MKTPNNSFEACFRPQHNRFAVLRHLLAIAVLTDHAFILLGFGGVLQSTGYETSLGTVAVAGFFILSGSLITASWMHSPRVADFALNRVLRIFPGYLVCLLVTAAGIGPLAWALQTGEFAGYWSSEPGPLAYVLKNSLLMQFQTRIGDLFQHHAEPLSVNGSLWSIPWEAGCYLLTALLGVMRIIPRRPFLLVAAVLAVLANVLLAPAGSVLGLVFMSERIILLPMYFLAGAAFYVYRKQIPHSPWLGGLAITLCVVAGCYHWPLTALLFAPYALFYLGTVGVSAEASTKRQTWDLSYGIYIYGFPVQQLLVAAGLAGTGPLALIALSLLLVVPLAGLSWYFVESPCLRSKRKQLLVV